MNNTTTTTNRTDDIIEVRTKNHGHWAVYNDVVFRLTDCCQASGKGTMIGDRPAIVCRDCHYEVSMIFGDATEIGSDDFWAGVERMMPYCNGAFPTDCVAQVIHEIEEALK